MDIGITLGQRIVLFRQLKGWSQTRLWQAAGIGQSRMSDIENDNARATFDEVERLALFLEQPLEYFSILRKVVLPPELMTTLRTMAEADAKAKGRKNRYTRMPPPHDQLATGM